MEFSYLYIFIFIYLIFFMDNLLDKILIESYELCASDIHLVVGSKPIFRIDGELISREEYITITRESILDLIKSFLQEEYFNRFLKNKELDISYDIKNISRFRVNLYFERDNPCFVARIISKKIPKMEEFKLPSVVSDLVSSFRGLVLVTGPTGSGKSTTLASMVDFINENQAKNIITIEDPIEFVYESKKSLITQRQFDIDTFSYDEALKHVLRQDPNVIMVGEMRDLETIASTITLAESGHLVFSTLHTFNACQTIDRIIDVFPVSAQAQIRTQLSMTLSLVVSQRLIPKIGGGRVAVREIMINTPAIANLIREGKTSQINNIIQTSSAEGMFTMKQNVEQLINMGVVDKKYEDLF